VTITSGVLVGYWKCDEGSGSTIADSADVPTQTGTWTPARWGVPGWGGSAIDQQSVNLERVTFSPLSPAEIDFGGDFTASFWLDLENVNQGTDPGIIFKSDAVFNGAGAGYSWIIGCNVSRTQIRVFDGSSFHSFTVADLQTSSHIAVTFDGSGDGMIHVFQDGVESVTGGITFTNNDNAAHGLYFGDWLNTTSRDGVIGLMGEVALINAAVTLAEVGELYNSGTPPNVAALFLAVPSMASWNPPYARPTYPQDYQWHLHARHQPQPFYGPVFPIGTEAVLDATVQNRGTIDASSQLDGDIDASSQYNSDTD